MDRKLNGADKSGGRSIVFPVVNDLNYDQRMQRICSALQNNGFEVTLIGREMKGSKPLKNRAFQQLRFKHKFHAGKLFYLMHNWKLFWHYIKSDYDIIVANDLDTMVAGYLASTIKGKPFVYDAHEYFPELPEVVDRPLVNFVWNAVEKFVVPKLKYAYTINESYAGIFKEKYNKDFEIIRNATVLEEKEFGEIEEPYILYQGAVNIGRGVEQMIEAMQFIDSKLIICGNGDLFEECQKLVRDLNLEDKVEFLGFVEPEKLKKITIKAKLGFTFFTDHGMSYYYSLANRFFDYFHNGVPQLCINFPEYKRINDQFEIAVLVDDLDPKNIAEAANKVLKDEQVYQKLRSNCLKARAEINWQNEEKKLLAFYNAIE